MTLPFDPILTIDPTLIGLMVGFFLYFDKRLRRVEERLNILLGRLGEKDK